MPASASTRRKNSGLLRYWFGVPDAGAGAPLVFAPQGLQSGATHLITVLGGDAILDPDAGDQVFGDSVGWDQGVGPFGPTPTWDRQPPQAYAGTVAGNYDGGAAIAAGRSGPIPAFSAVTAEFVIGGQTPGAGPAPFPQVIVRTANLAPVINGVVQPGREYLTLAQILVSLPINPPAWTFAGVLNVRLEHGRIDVPNLGSQNVPNVTV